MGVCVRATASQARWRQEDSYQLADAICGLVNAMCRSFSKSVSVHTHHTGTKRLIYATHGRGTEQVFQAHALLGRTVKSGQELRACTAGSASLLQRGVPRGTKVKVGDGKQATELALSGKVSVFVRVSIAMRKHRDQKQFGE